MGAIRKIAIFISQYICGLVSSWGGGYLLGVVGILCLGWYCKTFLPPIPQSPHAYDDFIGGVGWLAGVIGGIPFGASLGILLISRLFFKSATHDRYIWRVIVGFIMGILSSAFVYWVFPLLGINYAVLPYLGIDTEEWLRPIPTSGIYSFLTWGGNESFFLIPTFFVLIGYNSIGLFTDKKKNTAL